MYNKQDKIDVIQYVRKNGNHLSEVNEIFRDDAEVVASAVLSYEGGGSGVLQYASERLQHDERIFKLVGIANDLQNLIMKIQQLGISHSKKEKIFKQIEERKTEIIREYFTVEHEEDRDMEFGTPESDYYLSQIDISDDTKSIIERGVMGTALNYPNSDMVSNLGIGVYSCLCDFLGKSKDGLPNYPFSNLSDFISRESRVYGIPLRNRIQEYYDKHQSSSIFCEYGHDRNVYDVELPSNLLFSIDLLRLSLSNTNLLTESQEKILYLLKSLDFYLAASAFANRNTEDMTVAWRAFHSLQELFDSVSVSDVMNVLCEYFYSLDMEEVFRNPSIVVEEVTDTAREVLSNASDMSLKDSFRATLLNGRIHMASDKGYRDEYHKQEDAVGSVVFDDNHFINIVADGVGGAKDGAIGSKILVEELMDWYRSLPSNLIDDVSLLNRLLNEKVGEINSMLCQQYGNQAQTTLVLALTVGENTIIANVGDSTAYGYDEATNRLIELSTLDSFSYGLSYEDARYNPNNNRITSAIGTDVYNGLHVNIIPNHGQRIILSSDGVTDLISEENYKYAFRNHINADRIVFKAKNDPDVNGWMKSEDNISAIVVDLPAREYGFGRG